MEPNHASRIPEASAETLALQQQALFSAMTVMIVLHEVILDSSGDPVDFRITDCNSAI